MAASSLLDTSGSGQWAAPKTLLFLKDFAAEKGLPPPESPRLAALTSLPARAPVKP